MLNTRVQQHSESTCSNAVSRNKQILSGTQWTSLHHSQTTHTADGPQWTSLHHSQTTHTQLVDPVDQLTSLTDHTDSWWKMYAGHFPRTTTLSAFHASLLDPRLTTQNPGCGTAQGD